MLLGTLLAAAVMVGVVLWRVDDGIGTERIGFQDADVPLGMPAEGVVDFRFLFADGWREEVIPVALRFDPPMGSEDAGLVYNAQKFWEMNERRGGRHMGDDLNGIGGMNTDLGDPVFAVADGLVLYAGEPSPGWGNLVIAGHRTSDGRVLHSMYGHLQRIDVAVGALVPRGGKVGTVGTANGHYPAHLHFEMRVGTGVDVGAGYSLHPLNRLDPTATVEGLRNAEAEEISASPLALMLAEAADWTTLEIEGAEKLTELE